MHVHPPKPLHGWREFLNEVLIVVIGILIALTLESAVEALRWKEQVQVSKEAVKAELGEDAVFAWERVAIAPCLRDRLRFLTDTVARSEGTVNGEALRLADGDAEAALPRTYVTPNRPFDEAAWQNFITSGAYSHISRPQAAALADTYNGIRRAAQTQDQEDASVARLTPLAYRLQVDEATRTQMLAALGDVDRVDSLLTLLSAQMLQDIAGLQLGIDEQAIAERRSKLLPALRRRYGACVKDIPLHLR